MTSDSVSSSRPLVDGEGRRLGLTGGLEAATYLRTVPRARPSCRAMARADSPWRFAAWTASHRACWRGVGHRGGESGNCGKPPERGDKVSLPGIWADRVAGAPWLTKPPFSHLSRARASTG